MSTKKRTKYGKRFTRYFTKSISREWATHETLVAYGDTYIENYMGVLFYYFKYKKLSFLDYMDSELDASSIVLLGYAERFNKLNELDKKRFIHIKNRSSSIETSFVIVDLLNSTSFNEADSYIYAKSHKKFMKIQRLLKDYKESDVALNNLNDEEYMIHLLFKSLLHKRYNQSEISLTYEELNSNSIPLHEVNVLKLLKFREANTDFRDTPLSWILPLRLIEFNHE